MMKPISLFSCFLFVLLIDGNFSLSQNGSKKTIVWDTYVQPLLDSISGLHNQKVIINDFFLIKKQNGNDFDSIIKHFYGFTKQDWEKHWDVWSINNKFYPDWKRSFSSEKRNKLTTSKRWYKKKIRVISVSKLIFLTKNTYLIEFTEYCPGLCSMSYIYFVEYDENSKRCIIKHKLESGVS